MKSTIRKPLLIIAALCAAITIGFFITGQQGSKAEDLVIPLSGITDRVTFYPATVNGTELEVLAVRTADGMVRTAFNTCQICYDSGRGYYKQVGDFLVCQNCGNRYSMEQIETEQGGCNPVPIFPENKREEADSIVIPSEYLTEAKALFASWKVQY